MCYGEVLGDKSTMYIRVTLYCDYFMWCVSCTMVVLTCFVMCGYFDNYMGVLIICALVFTVFCIVSSMYIICFLCASVRSTAK